VLPTVVDQTADPRRCDPLVQRHGAGDQSSEGVGAVQTCQQQDRPEPHHRLRQPGKRTRGALNAAAPGKLNAAR
jgi:hypothetical protein